MPEAKALDEQPAFIEDLAARRKFYGGEAYEMSRSAEQKEAFRRALTETMDIW
jgi:hypothetical protein